MSDRSAGFTLANVSPLGDSIQRPPIRFPCASDVGDITSFKKFNVQRSARDHLEEGCESQKIASIKINNLQASFWRELKTRLWLRLFGYFGYSYSGSCE